MWSYHQENLIRPSEPLSSNHICKRRVGRQCRTQLSNISLVVRDLPQNGAEHCHCSRVARRGNLSIASSLALIHDTPLAHQSLRLSWLLLRGPIHVEFTCKTFFVSRKQKDIASKWKRLINAVNFTGKKLKIVLINIFIDINVILHEILFAKMEFYHWPTSLLIFLSHLFYVSLIQS